MSNRAPESSGQHSDASKRSSLSGTSSSSQQPKKPVGQTPVSTNPTTAGRGVRYLQVSMYLSYLYHRFLQCCNNESTSSTSCCRCRWKDSCTKSVYMFCCSEMFFSLMYQRELILLLQKNILEKQ
jgi:hypothetical protein